MKIIKSNLSSSNNTGKQKKRPIQSKGELKTKIKAGFNPSSTQPSFVGLIPKYLNQIFTKKVKPLSIEKLNILINKNEIRAIEIKNLKKQIDLMTADIVTGKLGGKTMNDVLNSLKEYLNYLESLN